MGTYMALKHPYTRFSSKISNYYCLNYYILHLARPSTSHFLTKGIYNPSRLLLPSQRVTCIKPRIRLRAVLSPTFPFACHGPQNWNISRAHIQRASTRRSSSCRAAPLEFSCTIRCWKFTGDATAS